MDCIEPTEDKNGSVNLPMSGFPKGTGINPECEVIYAEEGDLERLHGNCAKNPGHTSFIPVTDFQMSNLPEEYQTQEMLKKMKGLCDLTVKILIKYISLERPDTYADSNERYPYSGKMRGSKRVKRFGTGFVRSFDSDGKKSHVQGERCPCPECKTSDSPKTEYWTLLVGTATHVIFDDSEAACAVIECFFDSEDRQGVKTMYGVSLKSRSLEFNKWQSDACYLNCITHDKDLFKRLHELCCNYNFTFTMDTYNSPLAYLISHPHGCSKTISFGDLIHITAPIDSEHPVSEPIMFEEGSKCRLPLFPWSRIDGKGILSSIDPNLPDVNVSQQADRLDSSGLQTSDKKSDEITLSMKEEKYNKTMKNDENQSSTLSDELQISSTDLEGLKQVVPNLQNSLQSVSKDSNALDKKTTYKPQTCNDYSHLGATSLSFHEALNISRPNEDDLNYTSLQTGEIGIEDTSGPSQQSCEFEEIPDRFFLQGPGFDFSLFGVDAPPVPPGAFIILSPEMEYLMKSFISGENTNEFSLQPGKEFVIPFGTTFTLPPTAEYAMRFTSLKPAWFTLPPGSKLTLPNGKDVQLPAEAEFLSDSLSLRFCYMTYDMATCPGSSGAIIHQEGVNMGLPFSVYNFSHFGALADGCNRSGLQNLFLKM